MTETPVETYVDAVRTGDADTAVATLGPDAVFRSPFNTWRARHIPAIYRARCTAFPKLLVDAVIAGDDRAVLVWRATLGDAEVEASELLSIEAGAIHRVDVFLRPAHVLEAAYRAMVAAWPRDETE